MKHCIVWKISGYLRKKCVCIYSAIHSTYVLNIPKQALGLQNHMEKTNRAPASKIFSGARNGVKACSLILNIQNGKAEQCPKVLKWRVT